MPHCSKVPILSALSGMCSAGCCISLEQCRALFEHPIGSERYTNNDIAPSTPPGARSGVGPGAHPGPPDRAAKGAGASAGASAGKAKLPWACCSQTCNRLIGAPGKAGQAHGKQLPDQRYISLPCHATYMPLLTTRESCKVCDTNQCAPPRPYLCCLMRQSP